jgi:thermitase
MGRTVLAFLTLIATFALTCAAASAQDVQLVAPGPGKIKPKAARPITWTPDTLLISPASDATSDDISTAMKEVKGKVVKTIGEGPLTVLVVQLEKGQLDKAETKLRKDKHFADITRDFHFTVDAAASQPVNDPYFPSQWHLGAINAVRAWQVSNGGSSILAVLDTGTNGSIADLAGKTYSGFDAVNNRDGQQDVHGHGTMVATTAAANTNNGTATAAPARLSRIYPVRIGSGSGISMQAILNGIYKCGNSGIKIINISANGSAPYTFANRSFTTLHNYMKWFHDTKGGLIFNSAGNDGRFDSNPMVPYLIVVSAIDTSYSLASFSTNGNPVWFTGPGTSIYCSGRDGRVVAVSGTSFSSPLVASVAAFIWGANPSLTNVQVENILKSTCYKAGTASWTRWYGYGMPNAEAAVRRALGQ